MAKIGYARVSTPEQNLDAQVDALNGAGCERVYFEHASGKLDARPEWQRCWEYLREGDQLVVTRLDRLGRSMRHLLELAGELEKRGIGLLVLDQGIDTSTATGRMFFHVMAALAEFEASLISERTRAGLAAARARGRRGGRPSVMTPAKLAVARQMLAAGHRPAEVARTIGVSRTTLYRHVLANDTPAAVGQSSTRR